MEHPCRTRGAANHRKAHYLRVDFNIRFRSLPAEVKDIIFGFVIDWNCKETPAIVVAFRTRNDPDEELYKAAWRAFCSQNTFVLTRENSFTIDQNLKGAMPPVVWQTVRNLEIKHKYMTQDNLGFYRMFLHGQTRDHFLYSPCPMCDYKTILLAKNVRRLHLDFGDSYHCIMPTIERTCCIAMQEMQLERLVLTVSNIWSFHTSTYLSRLIRKINNATQETGRLLSVSSKAFSAGPTTEDFASESWFWQATEGHKQMTWVDDWDKKRAYDDAVMEGLYGKRKDGAAADNAIVIDSDGEDFETEDVDAANFDTEDVDAANVDTEDVDAANVDIEDANATEDETENAPLDDDTDDLSDPDESLFPDYVPSP